MEARPAHYRRAVEDPAARLLHIEEGGSGELIGMGLGRIHDHYTPAGSGRIDDVWIDPRFRRRGLCRQLLARWVEFFTSNGIEAMVLDFAEGNAESVETWRALGFRPVLTTAVTRIQGGEALIAIRRNRAEEDFLSESSRRAPAKYAWSVEVRRLRTER